MAEVAVLLDRIDAEFSKHEARIKRDQSEHLEHYQARQRRLEIFEAKLAELPAIWKPRLDAFVERFGSRVSVSPHITTSRREAVLEFHSPLAQIHLQLSASTDPKIENLVLDYDLGILPILMQFVKHQRAEWPLTAVDEQEVVAWLDDRLVDFVTVFLSLHENEYYLKGHMVEDPIAGVRFPRFAAAAILESQGKTYHFISEETRREFESRRTLKA